jgi:hypothetical protein
MSELKLYQQDKLLWACLLFMKYTNKRPEWKGARDAVRATLGDDGMEQLTRCWKEAREDGVA